MCLQHYEIHHKAIQQELVDQIQRPQKSAKLHLIVAYKTKSIFVSFRGFQQQMHIHQCKNLRSYKTRDN